LKALIVESPGRLNLRNLDEPAPGPYEALVRIDACGFCGTTDREIIKGTQPSHHAYPAVLGHESTGKVVALGAKVRHFAVGDRVVRPAAIWPGTQRDGMASGWGGFAEFGIVRDREAMARDGDPSMLDDYTALRQMIVPGELTPGEAVISIALAETSSWLHQMPPVAGRTVCVSGTGIAGLGIGLFSKLAGASTVIVLGRREERLTLARNICADAAINVTSINWREEVRDLTGGGVSLFVEAVGQADQVHIGFGVLAPGGTVGVYGVAPNQEYHLNWGRSCGDASVRLAPALEHRTAPWIWDLLRRKIVKADDFLTHRWPLAEFETALREIDAGHVLKGLLEIS